MEAFDVVTILAASLLIGVEFTVSAILNPILVRLSHQAAAESTRLFARVLGRVMPFWYVSCLILLVGQSVLRWQMPGGGLIVTASVIWVAVILGSILWLVPINNRIVAMAEGYSDELQRLHRRWDWLHRWRVFSLVVALVCMLLALRV